MRIATICAVGVWFVLAVLSDIMTVREHNRLQRQAEAQERMWRNARDMQMRHWSEIARKRDELAQKEEQLRAQQQMLEELARQIVTGQDAGTTNEAGTV